jgi:hypothetical protein
MLADLHGDGAAHLIFIALIQKGIKEHYAFALAKPIHVGIGVPATLGSVHDI